MANNVTYTLQQSRYGQSNVIAPFAATNQKRKQWKFWQVICAGATTRWI
ncbi:hypothetical protein RA210_U10566 [Rubrivivax sp. A210]|nr:hypothetical protein RA210_U10566 [Rubrivivax sp. A210]